MEKHAKQGISEAFNAKYSKKQAEYHPKLHKTAFSYIAVSKIRAYRHKDGSITYKSHWYNKKSGRIIKEDSTHMPKNLNYYKRKAVYENKITRVQYGYGTKNKPLMRKKAVDIFRIFKKRKRMHQLSRDEFDLWRHINYAYPGSVKNTDTDTDFFWG